MGTWVYYVGFGVVVIVALAAFAAFSSSKEDERVLNDRRDPLKYWAQAAQALYQGEIGDAGYWSQSDAQGCLKKGWSTPNREELVELIEKYVDGECNTGFDKLRIIFLARVGFAAGWLDEATSWGYVRTAIAQLQSAYGSWPELRDAMAEGRAEWYGGAEDVPPAQVELTASAFAHASEKFFPHVAYR